MDVHQYDALTEQELDGVTGVKWTAFPGTIGAFIAEMDFQTAPVIKDALRDVVEGGFYGYLPQSLSDKLSEATAGWYQRNTGWTLEPEQVIPLPDVLSGLVITLQHFAPKGGKVIVPTPSYMPFLMIPGYFGRDMIQVPMLRVDDSWAFDYDALDQAFTDGGEVLVLCNPFNPIGRVLRTEEMERISEIVDRHQGRVFSDEIHAPLVFEGHRHIPYASVNSTAAGHTITSIAASKAWNLAGLKCAQLVLSNDADRAAWTPAIGWAAHGASTLGVLASTVAYNEGEPWLREVLTYLDGNRKALADLVAEYLPNVTYVQPEGTYLGWLDMTKTGVPDDLGAFFREKAQVAITDGSACGDVGKRCVRFNFAMPRPLMEKAIRQMSEALAGV